MAPRPQSMRAGQHLLVQCVIASKRYCQPVSADPIRSQLSLLLSPMAVIGRALYI